MNEELLQLAYSKFDTDADFETFKADLISSEDLQRLAYSKFDTDADFETFRTDLLGEKKNQVPSEISGESNSEVGELDSTNLQEENGSSGSLNLRPISEWQEEQDKKSEDKKGFFWDSFMGGMNRLNTAITSIPEGLYTLAAAPQNAIADLLGLPEDHSLRVSSEGFKEYVGIKNPARDLYLEEGKKIKERKDTFIKENYESGSVYENIKKGNYSDAFDLTGSSILESAPISGAIMASGGAFGMTATAAGTTVALTQPQIDELREKYPDKSEFELTRMGVTMAAAESVFSSVNAGTVGQMYKDIIKKEGAAVGKEVFKKGLAEMYKKALKKYGFVAGAVGEGVEEVATQMTQNLTEGVDIMQGVPDAFIVGMASGATMTAPMAAIDASNKTTEQVTDQVTEQVGDTESPLQELNIPAEPEVQEVQEVEEVQEEQVEDESEITPDEEVSEVVDEVPQEQEGEVEVEEVQQVEESQEQGDRFEGESDDTVSQGFTGSKKGRDSSLTEGGVVTESKRARAWKKINRFVSRTFFSNKGLSQDVVRIFEKNKGRVAAISNVLATDAKTLGKISNKYAKATGRETREVLLDMNEFLSGNNPDISYMDDSVVQELTEMRENVDKQSESLKGELRQQFDELVEIQNQHSEQGNQVMVENIQKKLDKMQDLFDTIDANMGSYLFRSYDIFSDPNYAQSLLSKRAGKEAMRRFNNAVDYLYDNREEGDERSKKEVETDLLEYIDSIKNKEDFLSARANGKIESPFLKKRKDLAAPIRELLGESKDPIKNYVSSINNIVRYTSSIKFQRELAKNLIDTGIAKTEIERGYVSFKTNNQGWDYLENIYVPQEFMEAYQDFSDLDPINGAEAVLVQLSGWTKLGKTVLSPVTTVRNFLSGAVLTTATGVNPFNYGRIQESFKLAWGGTKTTKQRQDELNKLYELGILGDGATSGEILAILNDMSKPVDRIVGRQRLDQKALDIFQKLYAFGDDAYKTMVYYSFKASYMKEGMPEVEAEEAAAIRTRNTYPTYSKLPKNVRKLRRLPLIGTFPSFVYEVFRTNRGMIQYMMDDAANGFVENNKESRVRFYKGLAGWTVATSLPVALNIISKAMLGISDEEEESAKNMAPEWQKDSQFAFVEKGDGTLEFIDLTAFFPQETLIKPLRILVEDREGRTNKQKITRAFNSVGDAFFGTDIFISTLSALHSNKSAYGSEIYKGETLMEGVFNDPDKIFDYFMTNAGIGVYNNIKEFARANADNLPDPIVDYFGEKESKYKEYTNTEAALAVLLGIRLSRIDYTQGTVNMAKTAKRDFEPVRRETYKRIRVRRKRGDEAIENIVKKETSENKKLYKETITAIEGYMNQNIGQERLITLMKNEGFKNKDIISLIIGMEPLIGQMSKTSLKKEITTIKNGRTRNEPEKQKEILEAVQSNAIRFNEVVAETNMKNSAKFLKDKFGKKLLTEESRKKLTTEEKRLIKLMGDSGLLHEEASGDFVTNPKRFDAMKEYKKLFK